MPFGLLTGLGAALAWGTMDILSALTGRRIGSLRVTAGIAVVGAFLLGIAAAVTGTGLPVDATTLAICTLLGVIGAGAYLAYFTGLQIGPIAVVSGMVAAYGGLTVVLAVIIRGETLTALQAAGAAIATIGVILTGVAFDGGWRATRLAGPGVIFAVVALVLFSLMAITTDIALETAGWLQVLLVSRLVTSVISVVAVAVIAIVARRRDPSLTGELEIWRRRRIIPILILAGALDVLGLMSFAIGLETAPTWMVGLASSFGPAVTIIVAVVFLGERLKPIQWLGLVGIAVGMIAIALP